MTILLELEDTGQSRQEIADDIKELCLDAGIPVISARPWSAPVSSPQDPLNFGGLPSKLISQA